MADEKREYSQRFRAAEVHARDNLEAEFGLGAGGLNRTVAAAMGSLSLPGAIAFATRRS